MIINGKRLIGFQTYKIIGQNSYELHFIDKSVKMEVVKIPLEYGGKLATNKGDFHGDGTRIERRQVSFKQLPVDVSKQVVVAINHIECNGSPMKNDQHIYQN